MRDRRPAIIVDNTMLGPLYQTPLAHGSDLVVTSLTKYVGGHSDLIAGSCSGSRARDRCCPRHAHDPGNDVRPANDWMLMRSLETMKLRMTRRSAMRAEWRNSCAATAAVKSVWYLPFLPEKHPDRAVFERQCKSARRGAARVTDAPGPARHADRASG